MSILAHQVWTYKNYILNAPIIFDKFWIQKAVFLFYEKLINANVTFYLQLIITAFSYTNHVRIAIVHQIWCFF